jgi:hypothetical protein
MLKITSIEGQKRNPVVVEGRLVVLRSKAAFRLVRKATVNRDLLRLYCEARSFLQVRVRSNRMVKISRKAR